MKDSTQGRPKNKVLRPYELDAHRLVDEFVYKVLHGGQPPTLETMKEIWKRYHYQFIYEGKPNDMQQVNFTQLLFSVVTGRLVLKESPVDQINYTKALQHLTHTAKGVDGLLNLDPSLPRLPIYTQNGTQDAIPPPPAFPTQAGHPAPALGSPCVAPVNPLVPVQQQQRQQPFVRPAGGDQTPSMRPDNAQAGGAHSNFSYLIRDLLANHPPPLDIGIPAVPVESSGAGAGAGPSSSVAVLSAAAQNHSSLILPLLDGVQSPSHHTASHPNPTHDTDDWHAQLPELPPLVQDDHPETASAGQALPPLPPPEPKGPSNVTKMGALFALYLLYTAQPSDPPARIYISRTALKSLLDVAATEETGLPPLPTQMAPGPDFYAVLKFMLDDNAFAVGEIGIHNTSADEHLVVNQSRVQEFSEQIGRGLETLTFLDDMKQRTAAYTAPRHEITRQIYQDFNLLYDPFFPNNLSRIMRDARQKIGAVLRGGQDRGGAVEVGREGADGEGRRRAKKGARGAGTDATDQDEDEEEDEEAHVAALMNRGDAGGGGGGAGPTVDGMTNVMHRTLLELQQQGFGLRRANSSFRTQRAVPRKPPMQARGRAGEDSEDDEGAAIKDVGGNATGAALVLHRQKAREREAGLLADAMADVLMRGGNRPTTQPQPAPTAGGVTAAPPPRSIAKLARGVANAMDLVSARPRPAPSAPPVKAPRGKKAAKEGGNAAVVKRRKTAAHRVESDDEESDPPERRRRQPKQVTTPHEDAGRGPSLKEGGAGAGAGALPLKRKRLPREVSEDSEEDSTQLLDSEGRAPWDQSDEETNPLDGPTPTPSYMQEHELPSVIKSPGNKGSGRGANQNQPAPTAAKAPPKRTSRAKAVRADVEEEENDASCYRCKASWWEDGNEMLLCEACDEGACHIGCLDPPLTKVPKDAWFCPRCAKGRGVAAATTVDRTTKRRK